MFETLWNIFAWIGILSVASGTSIAVYALWTVISGKIFDIGPKFVLLAALGFATAHGQNVSPVTDSLIDTPPEPTAVDFSSVKDGPLREALSSLLERIKVAESKQAEIVKEVGRIGLLESFAQRIERTMWSLFRSLLIALAGVVVLVFARDWLIRRIFTVTAMLLMCCSSVSAENPEPIIPQTNLVVFVGENCPPCDRWKLEVLPKLLPRGWNVLIVQGKEAPYPKFLIKRGDKWVPHVGFLQIDRLRQILEER